MANDAPQANQPVESKAQSLSEKMDRAVAEDNRGAYDNSMREINEARSTMQPAQQQKFDETLTGSLEFQTAALYDMKRNYSNIDADGDSRLSKKEVQSYADDKNTSPLQRAFINNHVLPNYDGISNISHDRFGSWTGWRDSEIRLKDLDTGLKNTDRMKHFYEKGADGKSLYERFKDKNGNLNGINEALDHVNEYGLSEKDIASLKYIQEQRSGWSKLPFTNDMAASRVAKLPGSDGFTPEQRVQNAAAQVNDQAAEKAKVEAAAAKDPVPSDKLMELAKVRRGEGPYHSAERILAADGKHHGADEVRAIQKALQQLYKEEGHGSMNDLRVNHQFITRENFKKLINMVNNEKARKALKKMVAA